jgi:flagellar biosynthetic protein FlhB
MAQADQDKTEKPTPHRLEEARKRGEVAKSAEVTGVVVMIAFAAVMALSAADVAHAIADATRGMLQLAGGRPSLDGGFVRFAGALYAPVAQSLLPLVLGLVIAAVLGNVLQTGLMVTTHPLKPDFKRLNPMQVVKRIFSFRTVWEFGKLIAKLAALAGVCALFVWKARALAEAAALTLPQRSAELVLSAFSKTSVYVLLVLALAALTDLLFTRREYMRKMRMSRRELKDEVKRRDGDPAVKSKQKQQIRDLLKKTRAVASVKDADVVLTNPTHVAVALRYRPGETLAPVVLAKGAGYLCRYIKTQAARHGVPVMRVPALARALYRECDIDTMVPEAHYRQLGPVYRELWARAGGVRA